LAGLRRKVTDDATIFHNVEGDPSRTVSGVIIRDRNLTLGEYRPGEREEIAGRYCGVRHVSGGAGGIELVADELGTIPTYYAQTTKGPMASNSIRLIALAMKAAGVPVRLSLGSIASTWFTPAYFTSTQVSEETYVSGVFVGLLGQRIIFREGHMTTTPPVKPQGTPPKIEEYRFLIDQGVEEIRENVIACVNSGFPVGSTLTGGRDSRLVLGALLSLGRERDVCFSTQDVNEDDTRISTALANYYGLSFEQSPDHVDFVGRSLERDLEMFTLANMGAKTLYKKATVNAVSDETAVRFVGGSGEFYRTTFTKGIKKQVLDKEVSRDSVRRWLRSYPMFGMMKRDIRELIVENWFRVFDTLGSNTIGEAIDLHYANLRNRMHLGAPTQHRRDERTVLFSPAASSKLFELAQRLPRQALESDRLIYDLTRAFNFDLAHLPYDRPLFLRNQMVARRMKATQSSLTARFRPQPELLRKAGPASRTFRGEREARDFRSFCLKSISEDLDVLQQHPVAGEIVDDQFRAALAEVMKTGPLERISTWLGKFRAARTVAEMA
jgi:hypothetical protein